MYPNPWISSFHGEEMFAVEAVFPFPLTSKVKLGMFLVLSLCQEKIHTDERNCANDFKNYSSESTAKRMFGILHSQILHINKSFASNLCSNAKKGK